MERQNYDLRKEIEKVINLGFTSFAP